MNPNENLEALLEKACENGAAPYRCHMDGPIVSDDYIKMACLKLEEAEGTGGGGPTISIL